MSFKYEVGMKVVCIAKIWHNSDEINTFPTEGTVYTIREVFRGINDLGVWDIALTLKEIINAKVYTRQEGMCEPGFDAKAFRPVKETNIDCFIKLLNPIKEKEKV